MIKSLPIFLFCIIGFYSCNFSNENSNIKHDNNPKNDTLSEQSFDILNPCSNEIDLDELGWYFYGFDTLRLKNHKHLIEQNCVIYFTPNEKIYNVVNSKDNGDGVEFDIKNDSVLYLQEWFMMVMYENKPFCLNSEIDSRMYYDTLFHNDTLIENLKVYGREYVRSTNDSINTHFRHFIICNEQEKLKISFSYDMLVDGKFVKYDLLKEIIDRFIVKH